MVAQGPARIIRLQPLGYTCRRLQGREPTLGDGRYIIRRELGRGTMGVVYEAEDTVLARTVAVKTIELAFEAVEEARKDFEQRFFTEARAAARLSHPGIVVCHDVGKDRASGKLFIVFEHLKGRTLAARAAEGPMEWRDALAIVVQAARAIQHAHEHGVVHRDLKPANIMLLDRGTSGGAAAGSEAALKIMDFGFARLEELGLRLTRTGDSFGTPLYMSPEQALGQRSGPRSDIFSLGSVLCTLLLGRPWFEAPSLPEIVRRVVHDDPPHLASLRPDLPASLDAVVATALAKGADDRYATAADMAEDLEDLLAGRAASHALFAGPTSAPRASGGLAPPDPLDAFLEELPLLESGSNPGAKAAVSEAETVPARVSPAVRTASRPPWLLPATAVGVWAVLAVVTNRALSPPVATTSAAATTSTTMAAQLASPTTDPTTVPTQAPTQAPTAPPTAAPTAAPVTAVTPRPKAQAAATPSPEAEKTRIRLTVEHPFENGRLVAWIDGVLVYEMKLQAPVSKKVVAFKVREGRAEKLLDLEPGRHEVRVEVTWEQDHRVRTKVVDVAPGSTGLLEVRVGRMSKDLRLEWSRLAKN
jgi:serine/threonine protein kinase